MAANGDPYLTDADLTSTLGDIGVYVDANLRPLSWIRLQGGVRADMFLFDVLNNCAVNSGVGVDSPSNQYPQVDQPCLSEIEHGLYREPIQRSTTGDDTVMPRGTVVVGPFAHFEFTASVGNGVRSVDPQLIEMGRAYGMSASTLFSRVILPGALPSIFVGLRFALGIMWLTLIVAETISASSGIGYMAMQAREFLLVDVVVLSILIYALLGKVADTVTRLLERWCLAWHPAFQTPSEVGI